MISCKPGKVEPLEMFSNENMRHQVGGAVETWWGSLAESLVHRATCFEGEVVERAMETFLVGVG